MYSRINQIVGSLALAVATSAWGQCEPAWGPVGGVFGSTDVVTSSAVFDDGSGEALYAGGVFTTAENVMKWDGTSWLPVGTTGLSDTVLALTVFDDGSGEALYSGGLITSAGGVGVSHIAKWDGSSWSSLGVGLNGLVRVLAVFDDGSGAALYAGGFFRMAGAVRASQIAKWDGTSWSPLGAGSSGGVKALSVFDDGSGQALYVGGRSVWSGDPVAKWDGTSWSTLGAGTREDVFALTVFGDGPGAALFAGGRGPDIVTRWGPPTPEVTAQPGDLTVEVRDPAVFSLTAVSTPGPMSIQWRKDGQPLLEDPPHITGTHAPILRIDSAILSDAGLYDAVLTNVCGPTRTRSATLTVTCYPDCDQTTGAGVLDLFDFLCFQSSFVTFGPYADCDGNNLLDLFDFLCFQDAFVTGCP